MIWLAVPFLLGIVFSALHLKEVFGESKLFYFIGLLALVFSCAFAVSSLPLGPSGPYDIIGAAAAVLTPAIAASSWLPFLWGLGAWIIVRLSRAMLGDERVARHFSFDKAELAENRRDYQTAKQLYLKAIEQMPLRPEPRLRLAELLIRIRRYPDAAEQLKAALGLTQDMENRARLAFRLAEALALAGQREAAVATLQDFEREAGGTKYADFARERLAALSAPSPT
jgi:tetratricopeptide (TPR) repeat protein